MTALAVSNAGDVATSSRKTSQDLEMPSKVKVLFADDDQLALDELEDICDLEGWEPLTAFNVEDALRILDDHADIPVVVTDVHFVDRFGKAANGIQFVSRARAKFSDRNIKYIVLSGDQHAIVSSAQEEAFDFLSKPLVPERLVSAIRRAVESDGKGKPGPYGAIDGDGGDQS